MWFFATPKNSAKMVKKWLKHGQKMFFRPKRIEKVVLGLKKIRSNWSENGQNMATHTHTHTYTHTHTCLDMSLLVYGKILQPFSYAGVGLLYIRRNDYGSIEATDVLIL